MKWRTLALVFAVSLIPLGVHADTEMADRIRLGLEKSPDAGVEVAWTWLWHGQAELFDISKSLAFPSLPQNAYQLLDIRFMRGKKDISMGAVAMRGEKSARATGKVLHSDWMMVGYAVEKSGSDKLGSMKIGTALMWSVFSIEARALAALTRFHAENPASLTYASWQYSLGDHVVLSGRGGYMYLQAKGKWKGALEGLALRDSFKMSGFFSQAGINYVF